MIAVDTNILVYAHRADSHWHQSASASVRSLAQAKESWCIPWPCLHEFCAIVTHPRIYSPPSTIDQTIRQIDAWMESPSLTLLGESTQHWRTFAAILKASKVAGPVAHDARVAAICIDHGVRELWTADRDFSRFKGLRAVNPLAK